MNMTTKQTPYWAYDADRPAVEGPVPIEVMDARVLAQRQYAGLPSLGSLHMLTMTDLAERIMAGKELPAPLQCYV